MTRTRSWKTCLPILFVAIQFAAAASLPAQVQDWKPFGAAKAGFRVLFPSPPETIKNSVPAGSETFDLRSYATEVGSTALYVGVCDYGAKGLAADPAALLVSAEKGAIDHMNAHLLNEKKVELATNPGIAFEAENEKLDFTVRMFLAGGVLYQVMVAAPVNEAFSETARFLDSFRLMPRPAPPENASVLPADWKSYRYQPDGFTALFPAQPSIEKQNIATDAGRFELRTYVADDSSAALIAAVCDYGASTAGKDPGTLLDGAKNGALANLRAHALSETKANLGNAHGIQFEAENESEHISARIYLQGSTLYQVLVVSPLNTHYADTNRFLDSFQMIGNDAR